MKKHPCEIDLSRNFGLLGWPFQITVIWGQTSVSFPIERNLETNEILWEDFKDIIDVLDEIIKKEKPL